MTYTLVEVSCRGFERFGAVRRGEVCAAIVARSGRNSIQLPPANLRQRESYDPATGTYVCKSCGRLGRIAEEMRAQLRVAGFEEIRSWAAFDQAAQTFLAGDGGRAFRAQTERATAARRRQGGQPEGSGGRGEVQSAAILTRTWRHGGRKGRERPAQEVRECSWCGLLLIAWTSPGAVPVRMHAHCMSEWKKIPEYSSWISKLLKFRRVDKLGKEEALRLAGKPPTPKRAGKPRDPEVLTRDFGMAVRHLVGPEEKRESLAQLAQEAGVDRSAVWQAIQGVLKRLPDPALLDLRSQPVMAALVAARAARGN
jgi:hypothetical protein